MANFHFKSRGTHQVCPLSSPSHLSVPHSTVNGESDEPGERGRACWPPRREPPARPDDDDGAQGRQADIWLPAQLHLRRRLGMRAGGVRLGAARPQARTGEPRFSVEIIQN